MVGGGVCKVIFMSNPTIVLRLGWGFDKKHQTVVACAFVSEFSVFKLITYMVYKFIPYLVYKLITYMVN